MAESNIHPSEEDFSYFCFDCRNTIQDTQKDFFYVGALGPCCTCTVCGEEFEAGFKREKMNSFDRPSYLCDVCGKPFRTSQQLSHHSYHHSNQWPHRCPFCQKGFAIRAYLERHTRKRNTLRTIRCTNCLNFFSGKICSNMLPDAHCEKCSSGPTSVEYVNFRM
ncbi:hypothetical protein TNIN_420641 [Trichonephila inaurata madagascariensis]|uniref:C2H2-type domain-containing protein n=1 Tax=Trichonephila inaurata madagascariensis TaxID=2747483 RepID=A0A8X6MJI0_9ARAC|nr:hypothetical protein TNIN_420641 [Trichonephila inaurata madagascariensis]